MAHRYYEVEGLFFPKSFPEEVVRSALTYTARPGDVFLVSYPKCGTTWLQHIVYLIFTDGHTPVDYSDLSARMVFLECRGADVVDSMPRPGAVKTHLPYHRQPYSEQAKYIYITRYPFDCCVSFYYHMKHMPVYGFSRGTFGEFFDAFVEGLVPFGDYFDHLLSWYAHRTDNNILFLTYENLKNDTSSWIIKVADFLGREYGDRLREKHGVASRIVEEAVKKVVNPAVKVFGPRLCSTPAEQLPRWAALTVASGGDQLRKPMTGDFVRKGEVGDWKNHFTDDQIKRMKDRIALKTAGSDVMKLWGDLNL